MQGDTGQTGYYFYRTAQGDEIDFLVQADRQLLVYEIKASTSVEMSGLTGFQNALDQLKLDKGVVVYFGKDNFKLNRQIEVTSVISLLKE